MTPAQDSSNCVYSRLGGNPDFGDIVGMFINELPKRLACLMDYLNQGDWEGVRRIAHQIKGAAGSYGFDAVSPVAGKVEAAVRQNESETQIRQAISELTDLCARMRAGVAPTA